MLRLKNWDVRLFQNFKKVLHWNVHKCYQSIENPEKGSDSCFQPFQKSITHLITFFQFGRRTFHYIRNKMSHTWNFELKIYVKWLVKFRRRIVQKLKVYTIVDFRGFQIRDRHNSSTWVIVKFLFSIFKNSTRVMIKYKISGRLKHCKGLKTPLTLCNLLLKSR